MNKKVYCYSLYYKDGDEYIPDRGIVFAEDVKQATDKIINQFCGNEEITEIQIFETDQSIDQDCFSFYIILSDCNDGKQISYELKDWHIIPEG